MVKGVSIKFDSYGTTIPKLLDLIKFDNLIRSQESIVLKPSLGEAGVNATNIAFVESILRYCLSNRNPGTEIFIAEGCDGQDTMEIFEEIGYKKLAEKYGIGLIDLNKSEAEEVSDGEFIHFSEINYPKILLNSFVISLPSVRKDDSIEFSGALSNMLGAFPSKYYSGFFSSRKNKLDKVPIKHRIHDILKVKMPEFAIADASEYGKILAGQPIEIDKQATGLVGIDWKSVSYLRFVDESFNSLFDDNKEGI
ncbi:hypothetical protein COU60_00180 [Candidatus Pacearchaeota archaeon CG10_big_fil_rev_8_21_14_0_10_34_76]|nr:MAG: hypothetical protein COU60_00180 [Candidatus Pacearchaeota archaeon CG10_big_fil_rev_8_21_14_0_10_34_76]